MEKHIQISSYSIIDDIVTINGQIFNNSNYKWDEISLTMGFDDNCFDSYSNELLIMLEQKEGTLNLEFLFNVEYFMKTRYHIVAVESYEQNVFEEIHSSLFSSYVRKNAYKREVKRKLKKEEAE